MHIDNSHNIAKAIDPPTGIPSFFFTSNMSTTSSSEGGEPEVNVEIRDASPTRYLLKIDSFSVLSDNGINKYESSEFESSGYKWKMIIYPNGDGDAHGYISVFVAMAGTSSLRSDWEVNATFSFVIFDQIHDNHVVIRGTERRFRNIKTEWGFSRCISHSTFKETSNGYLVNDNCVFGVDVYVIRNHVIGEYVSLLSDNKPYKHEWKITEFSKLEDDKLYSEEFIAGDYQWKILLYPNGCREEIGRSISVFLVSVDAKGFDCQKRVLAKYTFSVKDQISGAHCKLTYAQHWFAAAGYSWGWRAAMLLSELKDSKKGFLVGECCIVEADVSVPRVVNGLT